MIRCENCGYENPAGALVCRRCRHRLVIRREGGGPRRESEAELTLVVASGLAHLAAAICGVLALGVLLGFLLYRRVDKGMLVVIGLALLATVASRGQMSAMRRPAPGP